MPTEPLPDAPPNPPPRPPIPPPPNLPDAFSRLRYRFTTGIRAGETVTIRGESGEALMTYRSFASVVGVVALVVSVIVMLTGAAAVIFLLMEARPLPAIMALLLSASFAVIIAMLVPPTSVTLYEASDPVLHITQQGNVSIPTATYVVTTPERQVLARLRKAAWSRLGRNRWDILPPTEDHPLGSAIEESLSRALLRKVGGKFTRRYESNVRLRYLGKDVGWIIRRVNGGSVVDVLDLSGDIDRRIAVALATLILGSEP